MQKKRVLIHSNSANNNYGYSVVGNNIAKGLQKAGYQVIYLGMQDIHPPYKDDNDIICLGINNDPFGSDVLEEYIKAYKIDILVTIWDIWLQQASYIPKVVKHTKVKWILHLTINSVPLSPFFNLLPHADEIVAPSIFVYDELIKKNYKNVSYIPHGVNLNVFKPDNKNKTDDKFIFLSIMRNKGMQKNFPGLFRAYRILLDTHPKMVNTTRLWLLTNPDEVDGLKLRHFISEFGIEKNIGFIGWKPSDDLSGIIAEPEPVGFQHFANCNLPDKEIANLYNLADCYVCSTSGESFNLPLLESQACGLPVIAPNNSTGPELVDIPASGLLASVGEIQMTPLISTVYHVKPESLADCMYRIYSDKKLREEYSYNGVLNAKIYDWNNIIPLWVKLLEKTMVIKDTDYVTGEIGL